MLNMIVLIGAYLLGAIPFGLIVGKLQGLDIRQYGSGNIGTSNVARTLGKKAAAFTLLGDGLKGLVAVLLARAVLDDPAWTAAAGLAAVIGHNWPVYLKFEGGKGVTTTYGALLGLAWLPALGTILIWAIVSRTTNKASVAALVSAPCAPLLAYLATLLRPGNQLPAIVFAAVTAVLIYIRHVENIKRLLAGTELHLDQKIPTDKKGSS